jgi:uncharacterized protein
MTDEGCARLVEQLDRHERLAIAVSGGVDSMVLAYVAHRFSRAEVTAVHAVSPAVPAASTERVKAHAARHGWRLVLIDAGELQDGDYLANPVDRCFFCKNDLYGTIAATLAGNGGGTIASGTNTDDLGDYRPGLDAARRHDVVHPFVEAGLDKAAIYALARRFDLDDLAALPAQPCLASRIETGIRVDPVALRFIETVEAAVAGLMPAAEAIRCRVTQQGVFVECSPPPAAALLVPITARVGDLAEAAGFRFRGLRPYARGSAFLRDTETRAPDPSHGPAPARVGA